MTSIALMFVSANAGSVIAVLMASEVIPTKVWIVALTAAQEAGSLLSPVAGSAKIDRSCLNNWLVTANSIALAAALKAVTDSASSPMSL